MFSSYGIAFDDVAAFYLAGGFGRHAEERFVEANRADRISRTSASSKSNAAIEGACIALLSVSQRDTLETLVRRVEHCRLETHPDFFDFFVEGCQFKPVQSVDRVPQ